MVLDLTVASWSIKRQSLHLAEAEAGKGWPNSRCGRHIEGKNVGTGDQRLVCEDLLARICPVAVGTKVDPALK